MTHRLFVYHEPTLLSGIPPATAPADYADWARQTTDNAGATALALSQKIYPNVLGGKGAPSHTFSLPTTLLDQYVETHTDVWVETAEHHAGIYASANPTGLVHPSVVPPDLTGDLSREKKLSGDIGGVIGEGLFVAALERAYGLSPNDYVHLKPRYRKRFPDFAVIHPGATLGPLLTGATGAYGPPDLIPAEVKTVSRVKRAGGMKGQIAKALVQLLSFWELVRSAASIGPSMLFLAVLNPDPPVQSYDLVVIHGK